ncbi:MAG TPA: nuclear transport factor 2 family protein [Mycobacteriales bacterium]|nr:nuclear transport factor 2 family protein [Mycobacteriales bacterium]
MGMVDRAELEAFWQRWLDTNRECEAKRDWSALADFYAEDATYGWNCGPSDDFMAVGRDQIREWALGAEMQGLEGWTYPYQATVIDDRAGMVVGFWRQQAEAHDEDGHPYEVAGLGASWFGYADGTWVWQRDFFDHGNAGAVFLRMMQRGALSAGMTERIERSMAGELLPGHYRPQDRPAPLWPVIG